MDARHMSLLTFLQGPKQFLIPIWQRRYSWEKKECEQLWNDVLHVGEDKNATTYFLGSIVSMKPDNNYSRVPRLLVIDGQQRLTTLSLLLSALGRAIEARSVEIGIDRRRIENYYLFNADENDEWHYKQLLTPHDKDTLTKLLKGKDLSANFSYRLRSNYRFFEFELKRADLKAVYEGIRKLMIVDIELEYGSDNPQLIFDSLNSTGLDLTSADRIRNYVLMEQDRDFQNKLYKTEWYPMEQRFGDEYTKRFGLFIRDYLTLKTRRIPDKRKVYDSFKRYVADKKQPEVLKETIEEINRYSEYYIRIALHQEEDPEIRACLEDIRALNVEVAFPFLLGVYEDYTQGQIEKADVIETLRLIESYIFRRAICRIPTNSLNKAFVALIREVNKDNYIQSLKEVFSKIPNAQRYPRNEEFKEEFLSSGTYSRYVGYSHYYLLRKLENYGRKEPISVEGYTIEHVMPQGGPQRELTEGWKEELGENWEDVHKKYCQDNWQPHPYQAQFKVKQSSL